MVDNTKVGMGRSPASEIAHNGHVESHFHGSELKRLDENGAHFKAKFSHPRPLIQGSGQSFQ